MKRIVSLLPTATEIAAALGLMDQVVGVSHECDFPCEANLHPKEFPEFASRGPEDPRSVCVGRTNLARVTRQSLEGT
jgi:hypothetical protein